MPVFVGCLPPVRASRSFRCAPLRIAGVVPASLAGATSKSLALAAVLPAHRKPGWTGWGRGRLGMAVFAALLLLLCLALPPAALAQRHSLAGAFGNFAGRKATVTILARGSSVIGSTGNMDVYLALISPRHSGRGGKTEATPARLVHYYSFYLPGLPEERMALGRKFHLRLSYAPYCRMEAREFVVERAFDEDAVKKLQREDGQTLLPCFVVRE